MSSDILTPASDAEAAAIVRAAQGRGALDIVGGGSRTGLGRPPEGARRLSTEKLAGLVFHEPAEMTLRARAGTPMRDIEASLDQHNQMLPFEPMDPRPLLGTTGEPTMGGLVATALSGPRRVSAGSMRDSLIGLRFINGAGEILSSGGRVMKNVTGLDLVKIQGGAHGTLGLILEATFKLLPKPETQATLLARRLDPNRAAAMMSLALGSPYSVSGAAHLAPSMGREFSRTLMRVEGFAASVDYRIAQLKAQLGAFGELHVLNAEDSRRLWRSLRDAEFIAEPRERAVWRISLPPSRAAEFLARLPGRTAMLDAGGGTVWLATDPTQADVLAVRSAMAGVAGHATLLRAPDELRARVDVFEPLSAPLMQLTKNLKASLDPRGLFNAGRMYAGV